MKKKLCIFFSFFIFTGCFYGLITEKIEIKNTYSNALIKNDFLDINLWQIFEYFDLKLKNNLNEAVEVSQKFWLRPKNKERFQLLETQPHKAAKLKTLMTNLGFINEIKPQQKSYDALVVLGAYFFTLVDRVEFLKKCLNQGISSKNVIFLVSQRPLHEDKEVKPFKDRFNKALKNATETDLAMALWQALFSASQREQLNVFFIDTPNKEKNSIKTRVNTLDTVLYWQQSKPSFKNILVISSQPYIYRQDLVVKHVVKNSKVETVGPKSNNDFISDLYLDELARALFETKTYLEGISQH